MQYYNESVNELFDAFRGSKDVEDKVADLEKKLGE
jgi:tRNA nucleotidyltransferase/poly(A) polymerase